MRRLAVAGVFLVAALGVAAHAASAPPGRVQVTAREFGLSLSRLTLRPGPAIVELVNNGEDDHDLRLQRIGGGPELSVPVTSAGDHSDLAATLASGRYRVWCSIADHAARGMRATLLVRRSGAPPFRAQVSRSGRR